MITNKDQSPDFDPVPLTRQRHDGWSAARQGAFLDVLAATGTVDSAVRAVGMTRVSAYNLRKRPGAESFAAAWDRAIDTGRAQMLDHMMERAINGVTTIRLRLGGMVDIENRPDKRLLVNALRTPPKRPDRPNGRL
jgi:hypothetical protein